MLKDLYIKNFILIDNLKLSFYQGLTVLTGETGAGKSILIDSLNLILGARADFSKIRKNTNFAEVVAVCSIANKDLENILINNFIPYEENEIVIKRIITNDNKSKSFINDTPVSVSLLKEIGQYLIDIHGQFDNHHLLNPSNHIHILDRFISNKSLLTNVSDLYEQYRSLKNSYNKEIAMIEKNKEDEEYIKYSIEEIDELNTYPNEESELLDQKRILSNLGKINDVISKVENTLNGNNVASLINKCLKQIDYSRDVLKDSKHLEGMVESLETTYSNLLNSIDYLDSIKNEYNFNENDLLPVEERIMNLRTIANKHKVQPDFLIEFRNDLQSKLDEIAKYSDNIKDLKENLDKTEKKLIEASDILSVERKKVAKETTNKVNKELVSLKLEKAEFIIHITETEALSSIGKDKLVFKVRTNQGTDFGDLNKIASGGEMARFMLALKTVLSSVDPVATMILDEIDIGVGGEVADAIGIRLKDLSKTKQILVITHSHQVASIGEMHYKVSKSDSNNETTTSVFVLSKEDRILEIARMLSGSSITQEAIATATKLINR